jgi:hypothetical protein
MPQDAALLYDAAQQPFAGWWALALAWTLVIMVALGPLWLHITDAAGRADAMPLFLPYLIWFAFFLALAAGAYFTFTATREDRTLRAAAAQSQCRTVEGEVKHLGLDGALHRERFVLQGLGFIIDARDGSIAYRQLSRDGGLAQEGALLRLCYVARGRALNDRAIVKIWRLPNQSTQATPPETHPSDFWVESAH